MSRRAFTLVELLVVIAIIALLMGLLIPAVLAAREAARCAECQSNLHQIGVDLEQRTDAKGQIPSMFFGVMAKAICPTQLARFGRLEDFDNWTENGYIQYWAAYSREQVMEIKAKGSTEIVHVTEATPHHSDNRNALMLDGHVKSLAGDVAIP